MANRRLPGRSPAAQKKPGRINPAELRYTSTNRQLTTTSSTYPTERLTTTN